MMSNKTHERMWEVKDAPVLWIETIHEGDVNKMQRVFGINYDNHFFISQNQTTQFFRNKKSYEKAKKKGMENYGDSNFVNKFCDNTKITEEKLNNLIKSISDADLKQMSNKEFLKLYLDFFDLYSALIAFYRCTRPEFYVLLTDDLKKRIPEPKEEILSKLLNNESVSISLSNDLRQLSLNLYKIGKRRFEMHHTWLNAFIKADNLFAEIGKRIGLTSLEVKNCLSSEIESFLLQKAKPNKEEIQKRIKYFVFEYTKKGFNLSTKEKQIEEEALKDVKGQCANPGKAKGNVVVFKETLTGTLIEKINSMKKGDVLVATSTSPDMMIAIKKASAIVADEGGMLSHAAIVSREFNIPCIVGTGNATKALKEGDLIEIDAEKGIVKKIK